MTMLKIESVENYNEEKAKCPFFCVIFSGKGCPACKYSEEQYEKDKDKLYATFPQIKVLRVNAAKARQLADERNISLVPTFILCKNNKEYLLAEHGLKIPDLIKLIGEKLAEIETGKAIPIEIGENTPKYI